MIGIVHREASTGSSEFTLRHVLAGGCAERGHVSLELVRADAGRAKRSAIGVQYGALRGGSREFESLSFWECISFM